MFHSSCIKIIFVDGDIEIVANEFWYEYLMYYFRNQFCVWS